MRARKSNTLLFNCYENGLYKHPTKSKIDQEPIQKNSKIKFNRKKNPAKRRPNVRKRIKSEVKHYYITLKMNTYHYNEIINKTELKKSIKTKNFCKKKKFKF